MVTQVNDARLRLTAEDQTARGIQSAARNLERLAEAAERNSRRTAAAVQRNQTLAQKAGGAIGGALGGAAAAKVIKDSYMEFAQADRMLARIGNTAGKSREEMTGVGARLIRMANEMALPIEAVTKGLDSLVSGGRSLEDSMDFLPSVAAAAQASGAAIEDISKSAGALSTSMGITAKESQRAFDILVAGGQAGSFELKDMARYLPQLAPMAAAVGYKGEEGLRKLVAILQVVQKGTGDAGQAADATREVFSKMTSGEVANNFAAFGVDLKANLLDAQKRGEDMVSTFVGLSRDTLEAIAKARGLKDAYAAIPELFADAQLQAGMRALLMQPGAVRDLVTQLGKVDGTTMKNLGNITGDAAASAQKLANGWTEVQRAIGDVLAAAHAPEGLKWMADRLKESAAGFENIARQGFGGAVKRALNRDSAMGADADRDAKRAEMEGATGAERDRLAVELRELEERAALARGRFERSDTDGAQKKDGLPSVPDLPGPLPPELRSQPDPAPLPRAPQFRGLKDMEGSGGFPGLFQPTSFGQEGAQEDTLEDIARDTAKTRALWERMVGPNSPSGRFGGLIQRASLGGGGTGSDPVGQGYGGSGVSIGEPGTGPRGGTPGTPNMRYGRTGGGGGGTTPSFGGAPGTGISRRSSGGRDATKAKIAYDFYRAKGLDHEGASAMVANIESESNFNEKARGDGGTAHGLFQHRGDRLTDIRNGAGIDMSSAPFEKQLEGAWWEMNSGKDRGARRALKALQTPGLSARDKAAAFVQHFERPAADERAKRGAIAEGYASLFGGDPAPVTAGDTGTLRVKGGPNGQAFAGGETMPGTIAAARDFQRDGLPGEVSHFSAFNDRYHAGTSSKHAKGLAFDTTLRENAREAYAAAKIEAEKRLRGAGLGDRDFTVIDEKNNPSARSTGPHLHTQFNSPEAAAQYNAWSAKQAEARAIEAKAKEAKTAEAKVPKLPSMTQGQMPPPVGTDPATGQHRIERLPPAFRTPPPPSLDDGGSGFKKPAAPPQAPERTDQVRAGGERAELSRGQLERVRERPTSQARREMDREIRSARMNTYSDVGVA